MRRIISQGDTTSEYRNLIKKIVEIHRQAFTEENLPAAEDYLQELLREGFDLAYEREKVIRK